jgi:putative inorganic carbon (HCO3(-)) transporter
MPLLVFLIACRQPHTEKDVDHFLRSVVLFGAALALSSLYSWYQFFAGMRLLAEDLGPKDMLQTSFGRSNYLASIFVIILPLNLVFLYRSKRLRNVLLNAGCLLLIVIALIFTESRGAMISLVAGLLAWGALSLARSISVRRIMIAAAIVVAVPTIVVLGWPYIPEDVRTGLSVTFGVLAQQAGEGNVGGGRTDLWLAAIKGALSSDLVGIGLGNQAAWLTSIGLDASAHSLYLETLLETGIVGLIALLGILFTFAKTLWRLWQVVDRRSRPIAGALIASFLTALVNISQEPSFWAPQYSYVFWMMMGVAYAWLRLETGEPSTQRAEGE